MKLISPFPFILSTTYNKVLVLFNFILYILGFKTLRQVFFITGIKYSMRCPIGSLQRSMGVYLSVPMICHLFIAVDFLQMVPFSHSSYWPCCTYWHVFISFDFVLSWHFFLPHHFLLFGLRLQHLFMEGIPRGTLSSLS